jgi:hypothetical protein
VKFGGTGNEARDLVGYKKIDNPEMDEPRFIGATAQNGVIDDAIDGEPAAAPGAGDVTEQKETPEGGGGQTSTKGKARGIPSTWYD